MAFSTSIGSRRENSYAPGEFCTVRGAATVGVRPDTSADLARWTYETGDWLATGGTG